MTTGFKNVLFLCTGNYYRSRYAEEVFNHLARAEGLPWRAFSRGAAKKGSSKNTGPISQFSVQALKAKGISAEGALRYPIPCTFADFEAAQLAVGLKEVEHRPLIEQRFPDLPNIIEYWDVDDIELASPSTALAKIDHLVEKLISRLLADNC